MEGEPEMKLNVTERERENLRADRGGVRPLISPRRIPGTGQPGDGDQTGIRV